MSAVVDSKGALEEHIFGHRDCGNCYAQVADLIIDMASLDRAHIVADIVSDIIAARRNEEILR